jgi:hypothetical protein
MGCSLGQLFPFVPLYRHARQTRNDFAVAQGRIHEIRFIPRMADAELHVDKIQGLKARLAGSLRRAASGFRGLHRKFCGLI